MEEALIARLLATAALTVIYGNRIHWQRRPPDLGSLPALTVTVASDPRTYHHDGPDDLQEVRLQFDSRARTYAEAKAGIRAVLSEMELEHDAVEQSIHFDEGLKVGGSDAPTETLGGGTEVFHITMDIMVFFRHL